jgi:glycosyltransferase involved in cell wall biosynthesis
MPGSWPEPFGLVAIESLACGTPVQARRVGGLDEIIRDGTDGFFGDDVTELAFLTARVADLDRAEIRASVIDRFSATRMADAYEAVYARMLGREDELDGASGPSRDEPAGANGTGASEPGRIVEMRREVSTAS